MEIIEKIAEGLSNKEIGTVLFVSETTVKMYTSNIFQKLNIKRRTQAVQKAKELNLIPQIPRTTVESIKFSTFV